MWGVFGAVCVVTGVLISPHRAITPSSLRHAKPPGHHTPHAIPAAIPLSPPAHPFGACCIGCVEQALVEGRASGNPISGQVSPGRATQATQRNPPRRSPPQPNTNTAATTTRQQQQRAINAACIAKRTQRVVEAPFPPTTTHSPRTDHHPPRNHPQTPQPIQILTRQHQRQPRAHTRPFLRFSTITRPHQLCRGCNIWRSNAQRWQ